MSDWVTNELPSRAKPRGAINAAVDRSEGAPAVEPAAAILAGAGRSRTDWFLVAVLIAMLMHGASIGPGVAVQYLSEILALLRNTRKWQHEFFWTQYDIEAPPKPPPAVDKPPEPPPTPEPEPAPPAPVPKAEAKPKDDPYDQPPTPAQAAKVLTQKEDPNDKPEDLTGNTIVSGEGNAPGGLVSASGKGDKVVTNPAASLTGTPGGTGTGPKPPPPAPTGPDLSRGATFEGNTSWNCAFPPEADAEQIDNAVVNITVTVRPDGSPLSVSVLSDPGYGFGRAARICALGRRYQPALDRAGQPMTGTTPPIKVRFTR
ncbi:MAG: energy transducer TonB [Byssovorax sp.]